MQESQNASVKVMSPRGNSEVSSKQIMDLLCLLGMIYFARFEVVRNSDRRKRLTSRKQTATATGNDEKTHNTPLCFVPTAGDSTESRPSLYLTWRGSRKLRTQRLFGSFSGRLCRVSKIKVMKMRFPSWLGNGKAN